ncbi:SYTL2 protein, partial [Amia calva]|nr:SYTL2 protein [Amia calva]
MIDLSYLTEDEQQMIMTVLKRDAELKKAEEDRIKQLQNTVHDNGKLKYMTGEWFYEAKSKRHRDKIHGSDIIRASMRQKKPVTLLELSQTRGGERPSFINNGNRDIFVSPELSGLIEEPEEEEDQEGERKAVNPSLDTKHNRLKLSASSPAKQRLNPFNSVSVRAETADEKDSQLTNGVVQALKTSNGENLPPTQNALPSVINLNSESPGSSQQNIEQLPVPKKRTKIYKPQDSFSDSDGPFPRLSNKRDSVKNPGTPRGILKHNSSCSSNDSEMLQSNNGHSVNRPEPPSSRTPNAQTVVPQIAAERVEDSREGTEEFSFNSLERKQVRFSPSVRQKDLNRALELQDGRELGEHDMLDLDSTSTPDAEEDYILDRSEQDNGGGSGLSLTDALTEEFQEPEDSTLTSATTTLSDNAQPLSLSVNEVGPAGAGEREQLRSKGTEPPVAYLGLHSRSTDNCKQGDTDIPVDSLSISKTHAEDSPQKIATLKSFWEKGSSGPKILMSTPKVDSPKDETLIKTPYQESETPSISDIQNEEHMKYTPKSIVVSEEVYDSSASLKPDESKSPKAREQVSESVSFAKHKVQNEEQMKYNPKSIIVNEEVYDSSAAMIPDESKSPKAGEQVSELVSLAKHSTHVLQSSPVPLVRHLSQEDSYDEDQNLVRRVLERSSNRPVSSSKSLEDISSSLPSEHYICFSFSLACSEALLYCDRGTCYCSVSTVPNTPTTTFLDNEKMKQMSRSVPFLQQESDGTDSTSENSFHIGRKKKIGSSLTNLSNSSGMASMSSVSGSVMSIYSGDFGNVEVKGNIQFAMDYVEQLNEFHIFVVQCKDLAAADPKKNRSDPYVKSYLLPDKGKMGKRKTSVKKKTLNPTYNEILRYRIAMETLKTQTLNLSVWHNDTFGRNSFLGEVDVDLSKWDWNNTQMNFFPLKPRTPSGLQATDYRGEMRLALRFLPQISHSKRTSNAGEVHIWVKDCKSLPIIRGNNIDPFVKCSVLPDTSRKSRQKTRVLKKTANPMFNHTLVYDGFKAEDLREACVELTVWDHDRLVNHFLGGLRLGLGTGKSYGAVVDWMDSNTDEATLWERMIDSPNEWVEDVLPLRMLMMAKSVWK